MSLVDGLGAGRVAQALFLLASGGPRSLKNEKKGGVALRPATMNDGKMLLAWRNDPLTRRMSLSGEVVSEEGHLSWLKDALANCSRFLFIAQCDGKAVGVVRLDAEPEETGISLTVAPEHRGKGLAHRLIAAGLEWVDDTRSGETVTALIKAENSCSKRAFARCGFAPVGPAAALGKSVERWRRPR